ncbi:MAG: DUF6519 domain-containing protein, partial [Acidobacteriota bacterium]|nr:DUF6519 domain-containing protein [Acidobacteriota bacterium]
MKGDFSRRTFDPRKHYSRVLMQQGRVQLDADWNEQADLTAHRAEVAALDLIGGCGAPFHDAAFGVFTDPTQLSAADRKRMEEAELLPLAAGDFLLTAGRYYVNGVLCENDQVVTFLGQPDLLLDREAFAETLDKGLYVAYLDVWPRHLTALDDPSLREVALGGPDTATRAKTVWQIKLWFAGESATGHCLTTFEEFQKLIAPPSGRLTARPAEQPDAGENLCIIPPGAGYQGLENQLYRVEIHTGGALNTATFKWSRDNGAVATTIERIDGAEVTVHDLGPDAVLGFDREQFVEISDDASELSGRPGQLLQIAEVDPAKQIITLKSAPTKLSTNASGVDATRHPKLRRWDYAGTVATDNALKTSAAAIVLENGIEVQFSAGDYRAGDYWLIPARTATADAQQGNIEWSIDAAGEPQALAPFGIEHHYCRVALLQFDGEKFTPLEDCRTLFPPVTELTSLFHVGGDGQEVMPDATETSGLFQLPQPLVVGVANGRWPVKGARVRFRVEDGAGRIVASGGGGTQIDPQTIDVATNTDGLAACVWRLDGSQPSQRVSATLFDAAGQSIHLPVRFNANLSVAAQVAYQPGQCDRLNDVKTVQEAIDRLCLREQVEAGQGCDITVGVGGQFKTIAEAINELLKMKQFNICLCLMPGPHSIGGLELSAPASTAPLHVRISGCGPGTRVALEKPVKVARLASFALHHL